MTSKSKERRGTRRKFTLNPTTQAIRHALTLGLAMAAAQPVFAGTCDVSNPASATCDGDFIDTTIAYGIDDLTLVIGGELQTVINPLDGARGIDLYAAAGAINLTTSADMMVSNATAIVVRSPYGDIDILNTSDASISVSSAYTSATGIEARSYYGDISIVDEGVIDVSVEGYGTATGIRASNFYGDVAVAITDTGSISVSTDTVYGGTAVAVRATTYLGGASVTNDGDITADAIGEYGNVTAYGIIARGGYYNTTSVVNTGTITSTAMSGDGVGWAWGIRARGDDVIVDNQGTINTEADATEGYATAISSYARGYNSSTTNSGILVADASVNNDADGYFGAARAYGAMAWGTNASMDNSGSIDARASIGYGDAVAIGVLTYYSYHATQTNSGSISADAYAQAGVASAMGMRNSANETGSVYNTAGARIDATAEAQEGYAFAYGVLTNNYFAAITNAGDITATATAHAPALDGLINPMARAVGAQAEAEDGFDTSLINSGNISADAAVMAYGQAFAFAAVSYGPESGRLENSGTLSAGSYAESGMAVAVGNVTSGAFAVTLNYGEISAEAVVYGDGLAQAVGSYTVGEVATVVNEGSISAIADSGLGLASANGIQLYGAWVAAYNYADVTAEANTQIGVAGAYGISSYSINGSAIYNTGSIVASASAHEGDAVAGGVDNFAYVYGAYVTNDGAISADASTNHGYAMATGVENIAWLYGNAITTNAGDVAATATVTGYGAAQATGVYSYGFFYAPQIVNGGIIAATATAGEGSAAATGIEISFYHGDSLIQNDGQIIATASTQGGQFGSAYAYGIIANHELGKYNFPNASIVNHGDIVATATHGGEYGFASATGIRTSLMYTSQVNYGAISARATASGMYGLAEATGTVNLGKYNLENINEGSIVASAEAHLGGSASATGVSDVGFYYDSTTLNHGDIGAYAISIFDGAYGGRAMATALYSHAGYAAIVDNTGTITAFASADHGQAGATGVAQSSKYDVSTLSNAGDIVAVAEAQAGSAEATGSDVNSKYGAVTLNDSLIDARAIADGGGYAGAIGSITLTPGAHGYTPYAIASTLYNTGTISAAAHADGGQAIAVGSRVEAATDAGARTYNHGTISAAADALGGDAFALGSKTWSYYGEVSLANYGDILARADGGEGGHAFATGGIVAATGGFMYHSGYAILSNAGTIAASAHATLDASTIGVQMDGELGAQASNDATISALADAGAGTAQAAALVMSSSAGDIVIANAGTIVATANGNVDSVAYGVHMDSVGSNTLSNSGSIVANGTGATRTAVWSSDDALATIDNHGLIVGGIRTGALDDTLVNHAGATLVLEDAMVDLGAHAGTGNTFANDGTIVVRGVSRIDMGQGLYTAVPSLNPVAFDNAGVIDFRDGAADDLLTITGDLGGDGQLYLDVSGLHGTSDLLYVDGSVVDGSAHTINVNWLEVPTATTSSIALARVSGDATAASFVLGHVATPQGFLTLDFNLQSTIDASNASADVFSLGVEVTGLSEAGVLAASIAPGAQNLMTSQVGTWRQRMGLISRYATNGVGAWARMFQNQGTLAPELEASSFGDGGHFAFDQKNSGTEVGMDFALSDAFSVGLLLAKAEGRQHLEAGVGSSKLKGDTSGVYATWISPAGFYMDGSYRAMDFTAKMSSAAGEVQADGDAATLNFEAGYAWTLAGGLKIEPQLQYTQTHVSNVDVVTIGQGAFQVADGDASTARLGVMLRKSFGAGTVWTPYASLNAVHTFDGEHAYSINDDFFGATSIAGTSALVEGGVSVQAGKLSVSGGLNWQDGGVLQSFGGGQIGVRYSW